MRFIVKTNSNSPILARHFFFQINSDVCVIVSFSGMFGWHWVYFSSCSHVYSCAVMSKLCRDERWEYNAWVWRVSPKGRSSSCLSRLTFVASVKQFTFRAHAFACVREKEAENLTAKSSRISLNYHFGRSFNNCCAHDDADAVSSLLCWWWKDSDFFEKQSLILRGNENLFFDEFP